MSEFLTAMGLALWAAVWTAVGWGFAHRQTVKWRERAERMEDAMHAYGSRRQQGGAPTNKDGPPARVIDARIRKGARWQP